MHGRSVPPARAELAGPALALAGFALYVLISLRGDFHGLLSDSYVYLAVAREFALGRAADLDFLLHIGRGNPFPPLYPLVLALLGAGGHAPIATYTVGAALMGGVLWAAFAWFRSVGLARGTAGTATLVIALMPATLLAVMNVLSEPLYLILTLAAGGCLAARAPTSRAWFIAGLLLGLAVLVRSAGIAALAAFAWVWLWRGGWRCAPWALLPALGLPGAWALVRKAAGLAYYPPPTLWGDEVWPRVLTNLAAFADAGVSLFDPSRGLHSDIVVGVAAALAAGVLLVRLARREFDAWYLLCYAGMVLVWPHPAHAGRFLLAVLPFLLGYACLPLGVLSARLRAQGLRRILPMLPPILLVVCAAPGSARIVSSALGETRIESLAAVRSPAWYLAPPARRPGIAEFWTRATPVMRAIRALPPDACVATIADEQVLLYGHRQVVDLSKLPRTRAAVNQALTVCPYVLMLAVTSTPPVSGVGPLFPYRFIEGRLVPLWVERARRLDPRSPDLVVLARVAP